MGRAKKHNKKQRYRKLINILLLKFKFTFFYYCRKESYSLSLRQFLWFALLLAFLVQTHYSITKYRTGDTSMVIQRSNPDKQEFPSITFCPLGQRPFLLTANNTRARRAGNFDQAMRFRQKADYIRSYQPAGEGQE